MAQEWRWQIAAAVEPGTTPLPMVDWPLGVAMLAAEDGSATIQIDDEKMRVTRKLGKGPRKPGETYRSVWVYEVERGVDGTTPAAHDAGAVITVLG